MLLQLQQQLIKKNNFLRDLKQYILSIVIIQHVG